MKKYFGTDGVRGRVGTDPVTANCMLKLGFAVGKILASKGSRKVLIGKDTRISGYMFESALEAGLSSAGVDIGLLGPIPTPGIAYLTRTLNAKAGIVISASHNPYYDNGVKFFSAQGKKLPDELELQIEQQLEQPLTTVDSIALGKAYRVEDAAGRYIEFCKSTMPSNLSLEGLKIVVDCANGAAYHIAPCVFAERGAEVISIGVTPNGLNINNAIGSTHPELLQATVLEHQADLGIALDGDGDRVIMVDHQGHIIDGDQLLFIIAKYYLDTQQLQGSVVGTLMTNLGLEHALANLGITLQRTAVGDRYIMEVLERQQWILGGESSGHIICLNKTTTGDGIISALQVLTAVVQTGKSLSELAGLVSKYPQHLVNVRLDNMIDLNQSQPIQDALKQSESELKDKGRVLLRPSGTEPVIRVMVEGEDKVQVERLAQAIADVVAAQTQV